MIVCVCENIDKYGKQALIKLVLYKKMGKKCRTCIKSLDKDLKL